MNFLENTLVGLDGCPGGWIIAIWRPGQEICFHFMKHISEIVEYGGRPELIGIDIPIGLVQGTARECDVLARKELGARRSSVFPAPDRRLLSVTDYHKANSMNREWNGKGLSKQTFNLIPKIREVDEFARKTNVPIFEIHPELAFAQMAGSPMVHNKKTPQGFHERRNWLLQNMPGVDIPQRGHLGPAKSDDWMDSAAVAWSTQRILQGQAKRLPAEAVHDEYGLLMAIHF